MGTKTAPFNTYFLKGILCDDSKLLFEQWKMHLEFQYDFVKVLAFGG